MKNKTILLIFLIVITLIMFYVSVKKCTNNIKSDLLKNLLKFKDDVSDSINSTIDKALKNKTKDLQDELNDKYEKAIDYLDKNKDKINDSIKKKIKECEDMKKEQEQQEQQSQEDKKAEDELKLEDEVPPVSDELIVESSNIPTPGLQREIDKDRQNIKKYISGIKKIKNSDSVVGYCGDCLEDGYYYI